MNIFENIKNIGIPFSGKNPESTMYWYLDEDGTLYISGKGRMADFSCSGNPAPPWEGHKDLIRTLILSEGITELGVNAFESCVSLSSVILPSSVSKIHYCCFKNCRNLRAIETEQAVEYRFFYETAENEKRVRTIRFGINAFYGTPWALGKWGDFYIRDGILLAYFASKEAVVIPEEVKAIGVFAFKDLQITSVEFPEGLRRIEALAFDSSQIRRIVLPESIEYIGPSAFVNSTVEAVLIPYTANVDIDETAFRGTCIPFNRRMKQHMPEAYELALKSDRRQFGEFQRLCVREKRVKRPFNPEKEGYIGTISITSGISLARRIKKGSIIIGIQYEEDKIILVRCFRWDEEQKCIDEYVMYPCYEEKQRDNAYEWNCFVKYISENNIKHDFFSDSPATLENSWDIREMPGDIHEAWFLSREEGGIGKQLEQQLVELWWKV